MHELLAVGRVQLPRDRALEGLGSAGAVQGVRPARSGTSTGKNERKTEDISEERPKPSGFKLSLTGTYMESRLAEPHGEFSDAVGTDAARDGRLVSSGQSKHRNH